MTQLATNTQRFITFEGIDGAGKSTHMQWFCDQLRARGCQVILTREPGGTDLAEQIREMVLASSMTPLTELLMIFAARQEHLQGNIEPALASGHWVICDRYVDSTMAYQGAGRSMDQIKIRQLTDWVVGDRMPSRTYVFDLSPETAAQRRQAARQADRFEAETVAFFERVRQAYLDIAERDPGRVMVLDATGSMDQIRRRLADDLERLLARADQAS